MKTDSMIQSDVIQELKWDPSITPELIGVSVKEGIVTLSGKTPSYFEKHAAERAASAAGVSRLARRPPLRSPRDRHTGAGAWPAGSGRRA